MLGNGCSILHKPGGGRKADKYSSLKKQILSSNITTNTYKARYLAEITGSGFSQKISGNIKIKDDSLITINAVSGFGLPIARIKISRDTISVSSMLFPNTTEPLNKFLPGRYSAINPKIAKAIFLGNFFTLSDTIDIYRYGVQKANDTSIVLLYRLPSYQNPQLSDMANQITYSLTQNKITQNKIWDFTGDNAIFMKYSNFNYIHSNKLPFAIKLKIIHNADTVLSANITLKNIKLQ